MATSSPAPSNTSTDTATPTPTPTATPITVKASKSSPSKAATFTPQRDPPKSLRGLNKPKCSQCGNVARSRCPYLSCKSCCAKAQNPCPIHVLKQTGTVPEKAPAATSLFDQKSNDSAQPWSSLRVTSLRQLSQFNGTQVPFRARRPLTRKDAASLNQWRFSKLKEYRERNIEAENEAFDRYMQNVSLLEEALLANYSPESFTTDEMSTVDPRSATKQEDNTMKLVLGFKAQLRSNPTRVSNFRKRIQGIVDQGLRKSPKSDLNDDEEITNASDLDGQKSVKRLKKKRSRAEQALAIDELIEKLNKARNEEELQSCVEMKSELFNQHEKAGPSEVKVDETSQVQTAGVGVTPVHESNLPPRLWKAVKIDEETLQAIDMHFSTLDQIEDL